MVSIPEVIIARGIADFRAFLCRRRSQCIEERSTPRRHGREAMGGGKKMENGKLAIEEEDKSQDGVLPVDYFVGYRMLV